MTEYFLCFDPTPGHSFEELRAWRKELMALDQDDFGVQVALKRVNETIREKESAT